MATSTIKESYISQRGLLNTIVGFEVQMVQNGQTFTRSYEPLCFVFIAPENGKYALYYCAGLNTIKILGEGSTNVTVKKTTYNELTITNNVGWNIPVWILKYPRY